MIMELHENAKENIWLQTIRTMTEKEIAYKESIDKKIAGIKRRQIMSHILSIFVLIVLISILTLVIKNLNDMSHLIQALLEGFKQLDK